MKRTPNSARETQGHESAVILSSSQSQNQSGERYKLTLDVTGDGPFSLANHLLYGGGDLGSGLGHVIQLKHGVQAHKSVDVMKTRLGGGGGVTLASRREARRAYSELVERTGVLNVLEGAVEVSKFSINLGGSLLGRGNLKEHRVGQTRVSKMAPRGGRTKPFELASGAR